MTPRRLVVIGASLGGLEAVQGLLETLGDAPSAALLLVLHRAPGSGELLLRLLERHGRVAVREPEAGEELATGTLYVAPADYHLLVGPERAELSVGAPVSAARPSIDVLFESAGPNWGRNLAAVLLSGSSDDGLRGLRTVQECGGACWVQCSNEAESSDAVTRAREVLGVEALPVAGLAEQLRAWMAG